MVSNKNEMTDEEYAQWKEEVGFPESGGTEVEEDNDPFSPNNIGVVQFIMQARLYDVGMALLSQLDAEVASELLELHASGALMGPAPFFLGSFATTDLNSEETDTAPE
jgi:hypothetical protein